MSAKMIEGTIQGQGAKIGIVVSRWNQFITTALCDGCVQGLKRHGVEEKDITIVRCPGCFEIPTVLQKMSKNKSYDALISLGLVLKGDTPHFEYIAGEVTKGVASIGLHSEIPVLFGVLTADNLEQAIQRAGVKMGNKGEETAVAALEMISLLKKIDEQ